MAHPLGGSNSSSSPSLPARLQSPPEEPSDSVVARASAAALTSLVLEPENPDEVALRLFGVRNASGGENALRPPPLAPSRKRGQPPKPDESALTRSIREQREVVEVGTQVRIAGCEYTVTRRLGEGQYAIAFLAEDEIARKQIVIKQFRRDNGQHRENLHKTQIDNYRRAYAAEIQCAQLLTEPQHSAYTAWEYCAESFEEAWADPKPGLVEQVARMFQIAYDKRLDLDLHPRNLKIKGGRVVLVDFKEENLVESDELPAQMRTQLNAFAKDDETLRKRLTPRGFS
jgi:hypothetical protein